MTVRLILCVLFCVPTLLMSAVFALPPPSAPFPGQKVQKPEKFWVFIGTYTRNTKAKGIYRCELDMATGKLTTPTLAVESDNPSFLALHPNQKFLYACNEIDDFENKKEGSIEAFRLNGKDGSLEMINTLSSGGAAPCHVSVDPSGKVVMAANYTGGSVCAMLLDFENKEEDDRGRLRQRTSFGQHTGNSVNKSRQEAPHPHCIVSDPAGKFVLVADLGLDKIVFYKLDADKGSLAIHNPPYADLAAGAGPRHLAFHPNGKRVYVLNELGSTVTAFTYNAERGTLKLLHTIGTLPKTFKGTNNTTAEVVVHPSGKYLYVSNRGHDSIGTYKIDDKTGKLTPVGLQTKNIKTPRNFTVDPTGKFLVVANQDADNLVVFRIDPKTGMPTETKVSVPVVRPVCIQLVAQIP